MDITKKVNVTIKADGPFCNQLCPFLCGEDSCCVLYPEGYDLAEIGNEYYAREVHKWYKEHPGERFDRNMDFAKNTDLIMDSSTLIRYRKCCEDFGV